MQQTWQDFLKEQGAVFADDILQHFGDIQLEFKNVDEKNVITDLSHLAVISVQGPDAKTFLQGQLTCNLDEVTLTQSRLGAHCNLKGRLLSVFRLLLATESPEPEYYLILPHALAPTCIQNLMKYAMFSQVQIQDKTIAFTKIGLYGPQATERLADVLKKNLDNFKPDDCLQFETHEGNYIVCRVPAFYDRYEIYGSLPVVKTLWSELKPLFRPVSSLVWELFDIQAGLPTIFPETVDQLLPHHVNLPTLNAVSFNKGCYLGQEIIARMHYRGNIKKHMYRAFVAETLPPPMPGDLLYAPSFEQGSNGYVVRASPLYHIAGHEVLVVLNDELSDFEDVRLYNEEGPGLQRLELPYSPAIKNQKK